VPRLNFFGWRRMPKARPADMELVTQGRQQQGRGKLDSSSVNRQGPVVQRIRFPHNVVTTLNERHSEGPFPRRLRQCCPRALALSEELLSCRRRLLTLWPLQVQCRLPHQLHDEQCLLRSVEACEHELHQCPRLGLHRHCRRCALPTLRSRLLLPGGAAAAVPRRTVLRRGFGEPGIMPFRHHGRQQSRCGPWQLLAVLTRHLCPERRSDGLRGVPFGQVLE